MTHAVIADRLFNVKIVNTQFFMTTSFHDAENVPMAEIASMSNKKNLKTNGQIWGV